MGENWLSVDEIAGHLNVSRETVYKWVQQDFIPFHKVGKLLRFHEEEIDQWILSGKSHIKERVKKENR